MKICSLYGAGFYYIPGTDTCIKIGGFVRAEWNVNSNGSFGPITAASYTRGTQTEYTRTRFVTSFDVRSQTEYGTLRSYGRGGWQWSTGDYQVGGSQGGSAVATSVGGIGTYYGSGTGGAPAAATWSGTQLGSSSTTYFDRAFVQLAGFTFGKTQSFYDFFNTGAYSNQTSWLWMDTGGSGTPVFAYTAQFGNGLSATISGEDQTEQALPIVSVGGDGTAAKALTPNATYVGNLAFGGFTYSSDFGANSASTGIPDIVGNLRIDQAWGSAQVMGAAHLDSAQYYGSGDAPTYAGLGYGPTGTNAHPSDTWGYAIGGGISLNIPMLGKGDTVSAMANYCSGASRYCSDPAGGVRGNGTMYNIRNGSTVGFGNEADAYYNSTTGGGLELPKMYNIVGGINHHFNDQWQVGLTGAYLNYQANSNAVNTIFCQGTTSASAATSAFSSAAVVSQGMSATGCRDWSAWEVSGRVLWNPVANLDVSLEVLYHKVDSAMKGLVVNAASGTSTAAGVPSTLTYGDVGEFAGIVRVQRNFYP